ncbi:MAG: hypothetical protein KKH92_06265 [Firmicutes bacterium]|nr:hypothetical protein [Bacillota bacterium]
MRIKSMYYFEGINKFNTFSDFLDKLSWKIERQLLKERVNIYQSLPIYQELKKRFSEQLITIWPLKEEEVITWFDTLLLMRRLLIELFKTGIESDKIHILMEYPLIFGNHMRTDYLIVYERSIIVLEFGMFNQDERRSEERYTKKLQESITHRQVIANIVDKSIDVTNYVLIYRPEFDRVHSVINTENIDYNNYEISLLSKFIQLKINTQKDLLAINQLDKINIYY